MSFVNISPFWVAGGLLGLAAGLYALQWLRVRYREVRVVTTLFWREALEEAPARAFRERFRHLPAYLLILAICALMWLAIAGPEWRPRQDVEHYVLLLDGSAGMARSGRFDTAVAALVRDARRLEKNTRTVLWVAGGTRTLLAPGEDAVLLGRRLASLAPQAAPPGVERMLQRLADIRHPGGKTIVRIYGDAPVASQVLERMPPSHTVVRATGLPETGSDAPNAGITALGFAEAASGRWNKVDALVRSEGTSGAVPLERLAITLDGKPLEGIVILPLADGALLLKDLPAAGGLLHVRLEGGDALPLDDEASARLPMRPVIRVLLSPSLQPVLGRLLGADPAVMLVGNDADVVIRRQGDSLGAGLAALVFTPMDAQSAAFSLTRPEEGPQATADEGQRLAGVMQALGLAQIDATALAQTAQRPIEIAVQPGDARVFSVWEELLLDDYNFTRSRSFPVFVAESIRWLARAPAWYPYVAAGEALPRPHGTEQSPFLTADARVIDTLGAAFVPEQAGELPDALRAQPLRASLLDAATTLSRDSPVSAPDEVGPLPAGRAVDPVTLLLWLALVLLSLEWFLYQRGRMP